MNEVHLSVLLAGYAHLDPKKDRVITGICLDSRDVRPGYLFAACKGLRVHGLEYIEQALELGAAAVIWEPAPNVDAPDSVADVVCVPVNELALHVGEIAARFYGNPSESLHVTGFTGTNGKTSCSQILAQALENLNQPCGVIGTLGYGRYGDLQPASLTTPDAVRMQALLGDFNDSGCTHVSMEVSSHALDQNRVAGVAFKNAVFINLTRDHLDYHGDIESYAAAKSLLFKRPDLKWAIINVDDQVGLKILNSLPESVCAIAVGFNESRFENINVKHKLFCERSELHSQGIRLDIAGDFGRVTVDAPLLGRFNAYNLLLVFGVLLAEGVDHRQAAKIFADVKPVPGRMEFFGGQDKPLVIVDYAHTPDALAQALRAARGHCSGKLWCIFGCGGDRDRGKRSQMGAFAEKLSDHVIVTDDNP
ncbi:MAG: UDP-N-acetylmuramoyl-L-alanyl-D-glutamate--2,6-diaminopimelate ligase, partial [Gammaproteobacteria bacterium]|nr:UDP-N-acetylmuramoyl-L-alanyl-D-glutamate--2,6-diaminopimelate ligase [Gammaproteobacteria bacterium]